MKTLKIWLLVILSPIAACALIWAAIQSFQGESQEEQRARIEEERRWRLDPTKTPEYQTKLDESLREIARKRRENNPDFRGRGSLTPKPDHDPRYNPYGVSPDPTENPQEPGIPTPSTVSDKDLLELIGLGPPDPTPMTDAEMESVLNELDALRPRLTLPAVEDPGPEGRPHFPEDDTMDLLLKARELKKAGEIGQLAIRAIRNDHVEIVYQPMVYGEPRVVKSINASQPRTTQSMESKPASPDKKGGPD